MPKQPKLSPTDLTQIFSYDPDAGLLTWRVKTRRTKPGDEAGSVVGTRRDPHVLVTYDWERIPAENICWALVYGRWPTAPIRFRNRDRQDLRFTNLELGSPPIVSEKALAMRDYRARRSEADRQKRTLAIQDELAAVREEYPNIGWDHVEQRFVVNEPDPMPFPVPASVPRRRRVGFTTDLMDAVTMYQDHLQRLDLALQANVNLDDPVYDKTTSARGIYTVSLRDILSQITYDPETGEFITLYPTTLMGFRADKPKFDYPKSPRYVSIKGRTLAAHQLAWFMTYHVWPAPRAIVHRDGDPSNNSLRNLYLKEQPDEQN